MCSLAAVVHKVRILESHERQNGPRRRGGTRGTEEPVFTGIF
jgi:hypothetical protein